MEHKPLDELKAVADVKRFPHHVMSREERLERWIELLEASPRRKLRSLYEIEYLSEYERRACRSDGSPLTVAYEDPVLRAQGLKSDRVGDCIDFFGITERQMHHAFCSCHVGTSFDAGQAAARLKQFFPRTPPTEGGGIVRRIGELFARR